MARLLVDWAPFAAAAAAAATATVGCELLVPTDGLTGGSASDATLPDGGGGGDGNAVDGYLSSDGPSDGTPTPDGPAACDAGGTLCGASCVDTSADMHNCGACGHDCMFRPCAGGACEPVTVASGLQNPHGIALDANDVYFSTYGDGALQRVAKTGGTPTVLVAGDANTLPSMIVVVGTTVYFTDYGPGTIMSVPAAGGPASTVTGGVGAAFGLTADATNLYFTANGAGFAASIPLGAPPTDGGPGAFTTFASGMGAPVMVAVRGSTAFVTGVWNLWSTSTGSGGGTPPALVSGVQGRTWGLALDSTSAYFSEENAGVIASVPLQGGQVTTLASGQDVPRGVAVDGGFVYWCERGGGHVRKTPVGGGPIVNLAFNQGGPVNVVLDGTTAYWADYDDGTIRKVAK